MDFYVPTIEQIGKLFPAYTQPTFVKKGGFKAVYGVKCQDGEREALKLSYIPPPEIPKQGEGAEELSEVVKRLKRELLTLASCQSPFVVKLGTLEPISVQVDQHDYIAYSEEFLEGQDLGGLIQGGHRPVEAELRLLASCLFRAIQDLWNNGRVVHRDIKPQNIIKTDDPNRRFVLLDLGLAYSLRESGITRNSIAIPGTLHYIAPEMLKPHFREALDFRSDLYTTALTLYEYATGVHPFRSTPEAAGQTLYRILKEKPKPILEMRDDLAKEFAQVIDQMLKKIPALRPSNLARLIALMEERV